MLLPQPLLGVRPGAAVRGFFVGGADRGHHPALPAVDATNGDKRGESGLCLLGEHPSGQRKPERGV
jgi:hypothetical protein